MTDLATMADREVLRYAVQRAIFCEASGVVLDVRRAVLFSGEGIRARIVTADVWDGIAAEALAACEAQGLAPEVLDGRVLFG